MRSVVVAKYVPWPPNSGDKQRTLGVVRALQAHGEVTVCAFSGPDEDAAPLQAEGVRVCSVPRRSSVPQLVGGLLRSRSITAARFWDGRLAGLVARETASTPDALVIEHVQLMPYARAGRARTTVLDMRTIESSLTARYAASQRGFRRAVLWLESKALARLERLGSRADAVVVASETDRERLGRVAAGTQVLVVPNAWDEETPLYPTTAPVVCFVALLSWAPNVDAAVWFVERVWPHVLSGRPDAQLLLVGRNPAAAVRALQGPSVEVTGTVPDLLPHYARSRVAVAPLRSGGGSRLKILEALAHARPLVSTTVGVEGLEDLIGRGVVVADDPAAMADAILALLADDAECASLGAAGAEAVRVDHSWQAATQPLVDLLSARTEGPR